MTITKKIETGQPFGLYDEIVDIESDIDTAESSITVLQGTKCVGCVDATITVGSADTATVTASIQLKDADGDDMASSVAVFAYLSTEATGTTVNGVTSTTELAIGSDGELTVLITDVLYVLNSETDGDIDVTLGYTTGAEDFYLVLILPNGKKVVSTKFEFTAE